MHEEPQPTVTCFLCNNQIKCLRRRSGSAGSCLGQGGGGGDEGRKAWPRVCQAQAGLWGWKQGQNCSGLGFFIVRLPGGWVGPGLSAALQHCADSGGEGVCLPGGRNAPQGGTMTLGVGIEPQPCQPVGQDPQQGTKIPLTGCCPRPASPGKRRTPRPAAGFVPSQLAGSQR